MQDLTIHAFLDDIYNVICSLLFNMHINTLLIIKNDRARLEIVRIVKSILFKTKRLLIVS